MKEQILSFLPREYPWKDRLFVFPELDSTNNRLKVLASQGAPHGTVLIADRQTGGRGRMGRSFLSPPGVGIYMSILLRPKCAPQKLMHLTCAVAAATRWNAPFIFAPASSGRTTWFGESRSSPESSRKWG